MTISKVFLAVFQGKLLLYFDSLLFVWGELHFPPENFNFSYTGQIK